MIFFNKDMRSRSVMASCIFRYLVFLCIGRYFTSGHMMCWNSSVSPAFQSPPLEFCTEFAGFGCCTKQASNEIWKQYDSLKEKLGTTDPNSECLELLKEQMCQKCSPFSGHMFTFNKKSPIPGLCNGYCQQFYTKCQMVIKDLLLNDLPEYLEIQKDMKKFCNYFKPDDDNYCFPDLRTNKFIQGGAANLKSSAKKCLCLEPIQDTFKAPIQSQRPDDGTGRIFVALLSGIISVYDSDGILISDKFFDISKRIKTRQNIGGDLGFLGFTFHPKFKTNGKFYVVYTMNSPPASIITRFSEFSVSPPSSNKANLKSERVILDIDIPYHHHVGGQLLFGADGYFYIFMGDAGRPYDPEGNAQNKSLLLGKVLRIDLENQDGGKPYSVPADNPFVNDPSFRPEIYSYGLRNPWRCGMDLGDLTGKAKGRFICGDVGEHKREEVDLIKKGANYGWNVIEGEVCAPKKKCTKEIRENFEDPIWSYSHDVGEGAIGGAIYRGCGIKHLYGAFIFGEWGSGKLFKLVENENTGKWEHEELFMCNSCPGHLTNTYPWRIYSLDNDPSGEVFLTTSYWLYEKKGKVFRLVKGPDSEDGCPAMKLNYTESKETTTDTDIADSGIPTENVKHEHTDHLHVSSNTTLDGKIESVLNESKISINTEQSNNTTHEESISNNQQSDEVPTNNSVPAIDQTSIEPTTVLYSSMKNWPSSLPTSKVTTVPAAMMTDDSSKGTINKSNLSSMVSLVPSVAEGSVISKDHLAETTTKVSSNSLSVDPTQKEINQFDTKNEVLHPQAGLDSSLGKTFMNGESGNHKNGGETNYKIAKLIQLVAMFGILTFFHIF